MTIRGERVITRLFRTHGAGRLAHKRPIDAGTIIAEVDSNLAHLCEEGPRHLVTDAGFTLPTFTPSNSASFRNRNAEDVSLPSQDDVTHVWQQITFDRRSGRRYGPFPMVADVGDRPVYARPRGVRMVVEIIVPSGLAACNVCAAMTRDSSPTEIHEGRYIVAAEQTGLTAGTQTIRWDLVPDARWIVDATMRPWRSLPCAPTSSLGAAMNAFREFYLWFGASAISVAEANVEVRSVSAFEIR